MSIKNQTTGVLEIRKAQIVANKVILVKKLQINKFSFIFFVLRIYLTLVTFFSLISDTFLLCYSSALLLVSNW